MRRQTEVSAPSLESVLLRNCGVKTPTCKGGDLAHLVEGGRPPLSEPAVRAHEIGERDAPAPAPVRKPLNFPKFISRAIVRREVPMICAAWPVSGTDISFFLVGIGRAKSLQERLQCAEDPRVNRRSIARPVVHNGRGWRRHRHDRPLSHHQLVSCISH